MNHLNHKRKFSNLKRTDTEKEQLINVSIEHDIDHEIERLNREVSDLYQQIKIKKEKLEAIKIEKAVKKAKRETEERVRRESNRWLPTLDKVTEVQKEIIKNLSDSDNETEKDNDSDSIIIIIRTTITIIIFFGFIIRITQVFNNFLLNFRDFI